MKMFSELDADVLTAKLLELYPSLTREESHNLSHRILEMMSEVRMLTVKEICDNVVKLYGEYNLC